MGTRKRERVREREGGGMLLSYGAKRKIEKKEGLLTSLCLSIRHSVYHL